jgi:hypothetical protein
MLLSSYVRRAFELPPHVAAGKALSLAGRMLVRQVCRQRNLWTSTYVQDGPGRIVGRLSITATDVPANLAAALPDLCELYLDHRFDLLGSGWVKVAYGMTAAGMEGYCYPPQVAPDADRDGNWLERQVTRPNLATARSLWRLVDGPYVPIDWQIDFKSGFRWDGRRHFLDLRFGQLPGVDVKVPWELARLQHLPQLATAYILAKAGRPGFFEPAVYAHEVCNQILDFLAANPPRFGVNWLCPMDVGIRAANMLLAVDILRAGGAPLDAAFEAAVAQAAIAHGRHILDNLEWSSAPRSNHYLADLAGVMFCAAYLPANDETDAWLDFAAQQWGQEIIQQFHVDGGNFEGSTSYHRLSAELSLFSVAFLLGVSVERKQAFASAARHRLRVRPPIGRGMAPSSIVSLGESVALPAEAIQRLEKAVACAAGWSKLDGRPPQIGDNDSGRLFKLHPALIRSTDGALVDDLLDHRALLSAGAALFDAPPSDWGNPADWLDGIVATSFAGGRKMPLQRSQPAETDFGDGINLRGLAEKIRALPRQYRREVTIELAGLVPSQLTRQAFEDFGLLVFRGGATFLSLRCSQYQGRAHTMGHFHDDNLAIEIQHQGKDIITDPGSYLYTPLAAARNLYRSAEAHFAPRPQDRRAALALSPFAMRFTAEAHCVYFGVDGIAATLEGQDWSAWRVLLIEAGRVVVLDGCEPGPLCDFAPIKMSEGYGRLADRQNMAFECCTTVAREPSQGVETQYGD